VRLVVCLKNAGSRESCIDCWHRFKNASHKETQMIIGNLLTFAVEFVVLAFAVIASLDFVLGLCRLCKASGTQSKPPTPQLETVLDTVVELQHQFPEAFETPVVEDPWEAAIATPTWCCDTADTITAPFHPIQLLLSPAQEVVEQPELGLTALKLYKLHGHSVTKVADLPIEIPVTIKRYKLHKKDVVRLIDLEQFLTAF